MRDNKYIAKVLATPWLADVVAVAGILIYSIQLWTYAHTQRSVLDEGLYLYKGFLFASGRYTPYQDYGLWTNQMPLAFLIPGAMQLLFGPGLSTGRYFAVLLGILMIVGLWLTTRRVGSRWLGAGAIWVMALNPATSKIYSMAISEGLVAGMLMWVMFLTLGEKRPLWQLILGSVLTSLLVMTRVNMLPLLPLLFVYALWEHSRKAAIWMAVTGTLTLVVTHVFFWPGILKIWAIWLPKAITPFLNTWRPPPGVIPFWNPDVAISDRINSFFEAVRFHFVPMVGVLTTWLLWPRREAWKTSSHFRMAIYLSALFITMVLMHTWASLGHDYCVFCLRIYTAFYSGIGLLLFVVSIHAWQRNLSRSRQGAAILMVITLLLGIAYSAYTVINTVFPIQFYRSLIAFRVPAMRAGRILSEQVEIWKPFANRFDLTYESILETVKVAFPMLLGFLVGILILLVSALLPRLIPRNTLIAQSTAGTRMLWSFLLIGVLLLPTDLLGNGYKIYDCGGDEIATFETVGKYLAETIPPQSQIYWRGYSPVNLLYLPDVNIYPPQLNLDYTYKTTGDPDALLRYGWWNEALARQWVTEADFVLIEVRYYERQAWLKAMLESSTFDELPPTPSTAPCRDDALIRIFRRKP